MNLLDSNVVLDVHSDPFRRRCIDRFSLRAYLRDAFFGGGWRFTATVHFKNGSTSGEQDFEADSFDELLRLVKAYVEGLQ